MNDNQEQDLLPPDIERLVNDIEVGNVLWYLMGGNPQIGIFLAFEIGQGAILSDSVRSAMLALNNKFQTNQMVRQAMFDYAMTAGIAYHEHGTAKPIWNIDGTVQ